jgi:hypothetical protein
MFVEDIAYSDIAIYLDRDNTEAGQSAMAPGQPDLCRAGFVLRNVDNVRLHNVQVSDQIGPAVSVTNGRRVSLAHVSSPTLRGGEQLVALEKVSEMSS